MKRRGFVEGECLVVLVVMGMFLAFTLSILKVAKVHAITNNYNHPALFALGWLVVFWGVWVGLCWLVASATYLIKWPRSLYPAVRLRIGGYLVDNKGHVWTIKSESDVLGLECKVYPAAPGFIWDAVKPLLSKGKFAL